MSASAATATVFGSVNGLKTNWTKELWESLKPAITKCNVQVEQPATVKIESEGDDPKWVRPCVEQLTHVLSLAEGWDSYGARGIQVHSVLRALDFLANVMDPEVPVPHIAPSRNGNVVLEWHTAKGDLEVEVLPDGLPYPNNSPNLQCSELKIFYSRGSDETVVDDVITRDISLVVMALSELS